MDLDISSSTKDLWEATKDVLSNQFQILRSVKKFNKLCKLVKKLKKLFNELHKKAINHLQKNLLIINKPTQN